MKTLITTILFLIFLPASSQVGSEAHVNGEVYINDEQQIVMYGYKSKVGNHVFSRINARETSEYDDSVSGTDVYEAVMGNPESAGIINTDSCLFVKLRWRGDDYLMKMEGEGFIEFYNDNHSDFKGKDGYTVSIFYNTYKREKVNFIIIPKDDGSFDYTAFFIINFEEGYDDNKDYLFGLYPPHEFVEYEVPSEQIAKE